MVSPSRRLAAKDSEDLSVFEIVVRETYRDFDALLEQAYFRRFGEPHGEKPELESHVEEKKGRTSRKRDRARSEHPE